ncbi:unnamed protein product (macronuclear) [Paramecium tetraurelia]|uniref:Transmembrane protein n=1 Tax=Paramecium tetraurelia TaxID=5888 RepID=A0D2Q9_PARTE|nr:uncharacterized protein GSPATT00012834001 [Paramecium tetraurelia]CAK77326.1 unnamed protein product [Paramecium tetraurelia]|eukprot:XP_001444723.1 hypothetical protein (macronuclear) [Paramecium tetraurelia strain d4-2]
MNIKYLIILIVLLFNGGKQFKVTIVLASKIKECQAKCDSQINICIYTCAQSQLRQSLESQAKCKKMCDGVNKECKTSKCYLES